MSYIYKVTNDVNEKIYIGKTSRDVSTRWEEHCKQYNQDTFNRPLYCAMKKYGIEHFTMELVEECEDSIASSREQFWIDAYNSYYNGYNATFGGDGRPSVNSDVVYDLFRQGKLVKEICDLTGYSKPTVSRILDSIDANSDIRAARKSLITSKAVVMTDKDTGKEIRVFSSANQACQYFNGNGHGHIVAVCQGKRKTAYGHGWKYLIRN